jgi:small subunit ribosomal protein S3
MGQKVHPYGFRLGNTTSWKTNWYAEKKDYEINLVEDIKISNSIDDMIKIAVLSNVSSYEIDRQRNTLCVKLYTDKVSLLIGKGGTNLAKVSNRLSKITGKKVLVDVKEIRTNSYADVALLSEMIAARISSGRGFKDIVKNCQEIVRSGEQKTTKDSKTKVIGIKIAISGRINGAEIARSESMSFGRIPLSSISTQIDYKCSHVTTQYGVIGLKIWIAKKQKFYI